MIDLGKFRRFWANRAGGFALQGAVLAPFLLAAAAGGLDFYAFNNHKTKLQATADLAALASAKEANLQGWSQEIVNAVANNYLAAHAEETSISGQLYKAYAKADPSNQLVKVVVTQDYYPYFLNFIYPSPQITVSATAQFSSTKKVCLLGLMKPQLLAKASVHMDNNARIQADRCSIISNSTDFAGLRVDSGSAMTADFICSAGGVMRSWRAKIQPSPVTRCPKLDDPLSSRPEPAFGGCTFSKLTITSDQTLQPGVYCGGLRISGTASVNLASGLYVIKDGPLVVEDGTSLTGDHVSLYLTGEGSTFSFATNSSISLTAMKTGPTAGILIAEDRSTPHSFQFNPFLLSHLPRNVRLHTISSNDARQLLGTIYLPNSILMIDAQAPVADSSAYTAIVVGRMWLRSGPTLVLNSDYSATDVPVPAGLGGGAPKLIQ
ncbi:MAG: pilus assembly protein TadG-related protein [Pseudomonadota bacterium]